MSRQPSPVRGCLYLLGLVVLSWVGVGLLVFGLALIVKAAWEW